ncbi:calcium-transporting P-type ATPase, PMR1-type [Desulfitibacter alkalitolerans]|uniref:calcium-transporting P-type ATPase, PMR1-type n=1 Tax=Desulfitibacter alkalitolerans TaxID=264641 RepID=UPI00047F796B|nr:calcium-transporting P-type ATPase, PMR1-type [Desulfitibacter alkalitolerans]
MREYKWYQLSCEKVLEVLQTDKEQGLDSSVAEKRLSLYGLNTLEEKAGINPWKIFISQFTDFMVLVLLGATMISGILKEYADAITILLIVFVNAVLGFFQEYRAEKSLEALKGMTAPEASVLRNGLRKKIKASELVPGDIIFLESGDKVPADARIIEATSLEVEEAALTGESHPVKKKIDPLEKSDLGLGDRNNMVHMGTVITRGRAVAVIVATGMKTEMGQIAGLIQSVKTEETPLQKRLDGLGKWLVALCLIICAVVAITGIIRGEPVYKMFLAGVSLAVAAIPEGLPAIVTVALAIGVQKMIKRKAIIRKLPAVETLGCATVICSDKTGTLTQNQMTAREIVTAGNWFTVTGEGYDPKGDILEQGAKVDYQKHEDLVQLLKISVLCNNSRLQKDDIHIDGLMRRDKEKGSWVINGDPTEGALIVLGAKAGIWRETVERREKRVHEIPFDSERKKMSTIYENSNGNKIAYVKGAPEVILQSCSHVLIKGKIEPLTGNLKEHFLNENIRLASKALRVLGMAYKDLSMMVDYNDDKIEANLVFVGLAGMIDPPRASAIKAIAACKQAGIKPVMITGDYKATAEAIARELKISSSAETVIDGNQLDRLSDKELEKRVEGINVYARVSPKHKLRIVRALKNNGHIVAMTGDGVNDAPAVKEADIGVAMGITGTDVTKEASAMVLADDNFATIVAAIEEGRGIYDNIRKFIRYLLSCNVGEVMVMFLAALMGMPLPLIPIQILWVNLVTDGLPAMALGVDNNDKDLMLRKPRHPKESVFSNGLGKKILVRGLQIGAATLFVFWLALQLGDGDIVLARTMAFSTLVFSQLFHVFHCKSERYSPFEVGILSNPALVVAVACSTLMQLTVIYLPALQPIFQTTSLNWVHWSVILLVAAWKTYITAIYHYLIKPVGRKLAYLTS